LASGMKRPVFSEGEMKQYQNPPPVLPPVVWTAPTRTETPAPYSPYGASQPMKPLTPMKEIPVKTSRTPSVDSAPAVELPKLSEPKPVKVAAPEVIYTAPLAPVAINQPAAVGKTPTAVNLLPNAGPSLVINKPAAASPLPKEKLPAAASEAT